MHRIRKKRFRLFYIYIFSYLLVLATLIIAFSLGTNFFSKNFEKQISQHHKTITSATTSRVEDVLTDISEVNSFVMFHQDNLKETLSIKSPNLYHKSAEAISLMSDMETYKKYKSNLALMYMYIKDTDTFVHSGGIMSSKDFYTIYFSDIVDYDSWHKALLSGYNENYYLSRARIKGIETDTVCFRSTLSPTTLLNVSSQAEIYMHVEKNEFFADIDDDINYCDTMIYDREGNLILYNIHSEYKQLPKTLSQLNFVKNKFVETHRIIINNTTMTIAVFAPTMIIEKDLVLSVALVYGLMGISLILSVIFIIFFMRKNYKPLESILSMLNTSPDNKLSELPQLKENINNILNTNSSLSRTLESQNSLLENFMLTQLLTGDYDFVSNQTFFENIAKIFVYPNFSVVLLRYENIHDMFPGEEVSEADKLFELQYIIKNIYEELCNTECSVAKVLNLENESVLIVNSDIASRDMESFVREKIKYGSSVICDNFYVNINFADSAVYTALSELSNAFCEVQQKYNNRFSDENITLCNRIANYIIENYTDSALCVNTVADHFGYSAYYISTVFKKFYNEPLLDFIHKYRLEKAKELIADGKYSLSEIAEKTGYNHVRTFNRIFKKYLFVTPSTYKKTL